MGIPVLGVTEQSGGREGVPLFLSVRSFPNETLMQAYAGKRGVTCDKNGPRTMITLRDRAGQCRYDTPATRRIQGPLRWMERRRRSRSPGDC